MQDSLKDKLELVYVQNTAEVFISAVSVIDSTENTTILFEKKPIGASNLTFHPPLV